MSRTLRITVSVLAWWVATTLPAILALAGSFGDISVDGEISGWVAAWWCGGWFAAVGAIFWVAHEVGHHRDWWIITTSMLPWLVDLGTPYGWGVGLALIAVAGGVASFMLWSSLRSVALDTLGRRAIGTVVKVLPSRMNVVVNNVYIKRKVLLDIPDERGSTYQAVLPMLCEIGTRPDPGDTFHLRVDPRNPQHFALDPRYLAGRDQGATPP